MLIEIFNKSWQLHFFEKFTAIILINMFRCRSPKIFWDSYWILTENSCLKLEPKHENKKPRGWINRNIKMDYLISRLRVFFSVILDKYIILMRWKSELQSFSTKCKMSSKITKNQNSKQRQISWWQKQIQTSWFLL